MQISAPDTNIASIQSAISTATLQQSMNQDAQSVAGLLEGMEEMSAEIQEIQNNANGQGSKAVNLDVYV